MREILWMSIKIPHSLSNLESIWGLCVSCETILTLKISFQTILEMNLAQ